MHISPLRQQDVDSSSPLVVTTDDDTRCVVTPGVSGVISLQLSPAELIRAETVKARHNVPSLCHTVLLSPWPRSHLSWSHIKQEKIIYDIGSDTHNLQDFDFDFYSIPKELLGVGHTCRTEELNGRQLNIPSYVYFVFSLLAAPQCELS